MKLSVTTSHRLFAVAVIFSICSLVDAQTKKPVKQVSGGILNGKALTLPRPEYPEDARKAKLSGTVKIKILIDETGKVISATAKSGLENVSLRIAAETAALKATFSPTRLSGKPVKVSGVIIYDFVAEKSNEEKLEVLAVSAFLTIARAFAPDLDKFKEIFADTESKELINDIANLGEFAPEFKDLQSIEKMSVDKRIETIDSVLSSFRSKLNESDRWQFETGKNLGELLGSMMWFIATGNPPEDLSKLDMASLKLSLNKIRDLMLSAPADFPQDVLAKLTDVAAIGNKEDLSSPENMQQFFEKLEALFEVVSPGSTK